jgi:alpha-1,3-rhamnosyl/mannosyltransferase
VPAVVTLHDLAVLRYPETLPLKVRWSLRPFLERSVERAARLVVPSRATAREVEAVFPAARGKLRVIPHGVDPEFVPLPAEAVRTERARRGAPAGYFLFVGSLEPRKNVALLLDAWEAIRREQGEAALPLFVVGPAGWKNREVGARLDALAPLGVRRLGRLERADLARLVASATALVYPSLYEGFGLPVAEAMACGVPVVVSDRSSLPEVAGDGGLTVDADDAGALAAALEAIATEPERARRLGERGLALARGYRWERAAAAHAEVFREALAEGGS